ncbi:hypothetical protein B0H66DRAFT_173942 [Apodospora peruviana]|uniref:RING-type E3 ubiquitin transferase n=1 Tax=Apodospora peruviana TaxID=516989 RepID=A0AAE0IAH4_9PEZI|nr:hypothetical protein B0H66DRAFT_173942 [Apodospora peruviana]
MDGGAELSDVDNIQAQVFQTTLAEISTSRLTNVANDTSRSANGGAKGMTTAADCCVICLDTISEPCTAHPCGHVHFDFLCLLSWLQQRASCPLCQSAVYKVCYTNDEKIESVYRVPNAPKRRENDERENRSDTRPLRRGAAQEEGQSLGPHDRQRQRRAAAGAPSPLGDAIQRRRHVYRRQLYSLRSNRRSQYKPPPTPAQFIAEPHLVSRARLWVRRELQVFAFLSDNLDDTTLPNGGTRHDTERQQMRRRNNAEFLLEYIVAILKTVDIQGCAGQAEQMLAEFLGRDHARLFLHELRSWMRSPCQSLVAWDREVQYPHVLQQKRPLESDETDDSDDRRSDGRRPRRHDEGVRRTSSTPTTTAERKRRYQEFSGELDTLRITKAATRYGSSRDRDIDHRPIT